MMTALEQLSERLKHLNGKWVVGGSCGLILHGVELTAQPRDLDIYVDEHIVRDVAASLQPIAIDAPHFSETAIYRSTLSHYQIDGVHIECVGGFEIRSDGSLYRVEVDKLMAPYSTDYMTDGIQVKLMALAHELVFNLLRKRADRYEMIAKTMRNNVADHERVLRHIVQRNKLHADHLHTLCDLLGLSLQDIGG